MTEDQAKEILLMLLASFPHADSNVDPLLAKKRKELFSRDLTTMHYDTMLEAVKSLRFSCKFFPSMAEIREHYAAANRPHPERQSSLFPALPRPGETVASLEQVLAVCKKVQSLLGADLLGEKQAPPPREPGDDQDIPR